VEGDAGKMDFLHTNLVHHHCMTDIIATSRASEAERIATIRFEPRTEEQVKRAAESFFDRARKLIGR
jgi:hypothetical protein